MTHCPPWRRGIQLAVGPPSMVAAPVASKGPIIHGNGVCSFRHRPAASPASASVSTTRTGWRRKKMEESKENKDIKQINQVSNARSELSAQA